MGSRGLAGTGWERLRSDSPRRGYSPSSSTLKCSWFTLPGIVTPWRTLSRMHQRLASIPGVEAVGGMSFPPVDSIILPTVDVRVDGGIPAPESRPPVRAAYFFVTPGLFKALRTPFVAGRDISDADTASRPWVAIVNEAAAQQLWPGESPIGRRVILDTVPEEQAREVVCAWLRI